MTAATALPRPCDMGAPTRFTEWRPEQADAWLKFTDSTSRFSGADLPCGSGKSMFGWMCAQFAESHDGIPPRTLFLTKTKSLQGQYVDQFPLADIRGQNNYVCKAVLPGGPLESYGESRITTVDRAPCHVGIHCSLKLGGCDWYDPLGDAKRANMVVTNYSLWLAFGKLQRRSPEMPCPLGEFDLLVLDEADAAFSEVCSAVRIELSHYDIRTLLQLHELEPTASVEDWRAWGADAYVKCGAKLDEYNREIRRDPEVIDSALISELKKLRLLSATFDMLTDLQGDWVIGLANRGSVTTFDPVWPAAYCEQLLYRRIPRIVLMSATLDRKTMSLLGVDEKADFWRYPSSFPVARRPIYIAPCCPRVDRNMTPGSYEEQLWVQRIDSCIDDRLDRKGIIHTVSYERAYRLRQLSRHKSLMITHGRDNTRETVEAFKSMPAPYILVSPSVTTGEDFPFKQCEYIIVAKLPFIDLRDPIQKRRSQTDREWGGYAMMHTLVQSMGRGMRDALDQCEVIIVDDHARWVFGSGKTSLRHMAPSWVIEAIKWPSSVPLPPQPLPPF